MTEREKADDCYRWALFFGEQKKFEQAKQYLLATIECDPNHANAWFTLGSHLDFIEKNATEALKYYLKAIEIDPNHGKALNNAASILFYYYNNTQSAKSYCLRAIQCDPLNSFFPTLFMAEIFKQEKNFTEAKKYCTKAIQLPSIHCSNALHDHKRQAFILQSQIEQPEKLALDSPP